MKKGIGSILILALTALLLITLLGACSDNKNNAPRESDSNSTDAGVPVNGGEITVGISQDLDSSLDPHEMMSGTAGTREVLFNVFEGLLKPDTDGELYPAIASEYSVDGPVYTFKLREGVKFHNGQALTAEDVVYSIERVADPSSERTYVPAFSVVERVEAVDESTVIIEIENIDLEFISNLTIAIIPKDYDGQRNSPVGTGPFKFLSYSPQENLIIEKNEDYWGESAHLDRVRFNIYSSIETMMMALNSGAVDICAHLSTEETAQLSSTEFNILEGKMNLVQAIYLNHEVEPLDNLLVRQALCYAVNIEEVMLVLADGMGTVVGSSMIPAFTRYFRDDLHYPYDPEKAVELLEEAGYPDGFNFTITVPANYDPHVTTAEVIVQQLAAVGINATIESVEWTTWYEDVYVGRNYQSTIIGVDAKTLTAQAMLSRFVSDAGDNFINYSNGEYDEAYKKARNATEEDEQIQLYKELQGILAEDAANVYLQDLCDLVAISSNLDGYQFYPIYVMDLSTVYFVS